MVVVAGVVVVLALLPLEIYNRWPPYKPTDKRPCLFVPEMGHKTAKNICEQEQVF